MPSYREPDYDDTRCAHCGHTLPENPEPDTPSDDGFCDEACRSGLRPVIRSVIDLLQHLDLPEQPADYESVKGRIARRLYKDTECGISFWLSEYLDYVTVAGYCEGDVGDCQTVALHFPFRAEDFDQAVKDADKDGCDLWNQTHGCPDCFGGKGYDLGACPVDENCPTCHGAGQVF